PRYAGDRDRRAQDVRRRQPRRFCAQQYAAAAQYLDRELLRSVRDLAAAAGPRPTGRPDALRAQRARSSPVSHRRRGRATLDVLISSSGMESTMWPDRRLLDLLQIEHPIGQAPMAGAQDWELVAAVSEAGGLGSLPCAMLKPEQIREQVEKIRTRTQRPINVNFFCHRPPRADNAREAAWRDRLARYYRQPRLAPHPPLSAPAPPP